MLQCRWIMMHQFNPRVWYQIILLSHWSAFSQSEARIRGSIWYEFDWRFRNKKSLEYPLFVLFSSPGPASPEALIEAASFPAKYIKCKFHFYLFQIFLQKKHNNWSLIDENLTNVSLQSKSSYFMEYIGKK